jgi:hypothetical protein
MRKWIALLCLLALCPACILAPAQAEALVHTGASGFTLTLPAGWEILIGGDEDDFDFFEDLSPGEEEALFSSGDGMIWVTVLHADDTPVNPYAVEALLNEAAMEARVGPVNGYQKLFYEFDEANRRAFILYALVADEGGVRYVEYLVGFITGSDIAQFLLITVREDQLEARFPLISEIVNGIDVGGVREGAEG